MDILASLIKTVFGSKADKDRKQIEPYVEKIKAVYPTIEALSNDELRARSQNLKKQIADYIAADEARIVELKGKLERPETSLEEKEKISKEIDDLTKRIDDKIEDKLDEILPEAFAVMKDTARRFAQNDTVVVTANDFDRELAATKDFVTIDGDKAVYATHWMAGGNDLKWDMIHYDCQLFGGVVLTRSKKNPAKKLGEREREGNIAEMATGEGKTLVATLPVFLNALAGKGVHLVTVNDYLAKRDSEWMGPLYQFHGLSVDCIDKHQPNSEARRKAYMADITFGTNNEFGFDYLRDNMASCSASTTTPSSMRPTRCSSTTPVRRSSSRVPYPRATTSSSSSTSPRSNTSTTSSATSSRRCWPRPASSSRRARPRRVVSSSTVCTRVCRNTSR